jgi:hypothetical protein
MLDRLTPEILGGTDAVRVNCERLAVSLSLFLGLNSYLSLRLPGHCTVTLRGSYAYGLLRLEFDN